MPAVCSSHRHHVHTSTRPLLTFLTPPPSTHTNTTPPHLIQEAVHAAQALQQAAEQANNDILAEQERIKAQADPSRWVCCVVLCCAGVWVGVEWS